MSRSAVSFIFSAAALAAAVAAPAQAQNWNFSYTGFVDSATGQFDGDYSISGSFSGSDANIDGILDLSEITALRINGTDYIACAGDSNAYYHCGTDIFSYTVGGSLSFTAGIYSSDPEGYVGGGHYFQTGDGEHEYRYNFAVGQYAETGHLWSSATTASVTSAPQLAAHVTAAVPEPGTWAMLGTGLLLVGGAAWRRRSAPAPLLRA